MTMMIRTAGVALLALLGATGCATNSCSQTKGYLAVQEPRPMNLPEGVPAPQDSGQYNIPGKPKSENLGCLEKPPMTLPESALKAPSDDEGATSDEATDSSGNDTDNGPR